MKNFMITLLVAVLFGITTMDLCAKPGNGQHNGTTGNNGNHFGWADNDSAPSGQPLPGVVAVLALGGAAVSGVAVLKRNKAKQVR